MLPRHLLQGTSLSPIGGLPQQTPASSQRRDQDLHSTSCMLLPHPSCCHLARKKNDTDQQLDQKESFTANTLRATWSTLSKSPTATRRTTIRSGTRTARARAFNNVQRLIRVFLDLGFLLFGAFGHQRVANNSTTLLLITSIITIFFGPVCSAESFRTCFLQPRKAQYLDITPGSTQLSNSIRQWLRHRHTNPLYPRVNSSPHTATLTIQHQTLAQTKQHVSCW